MLCEQLVARRLAPSCHESHRHSGKEAEIESPWMAIPSTSATCEACFDVGNTDEQVGKDISKYLLQPKPIQSIPVSISERYDRILEGLN